MKNSRLYVFLCVSLFAWLCVSCNKDHYDVTNVHGASLDGEALLPVASTSVSMMDMIQSSQLDSLITVGEDGGFSLRSSYEANRILSGDELLRFKDMEYRDHYSFPNSFSYSSHPLDTMVNMSQTIEFNADCILVNDAMVESGCFELRFESNVGELKRIVIRSSDFKDDQGHDMQLDATVSSNAFVFYLDGYRYHSGVGNTVTLSIDLYFRVHLVAEPELFVNYYLTTRNFALSEMTGVVTSYSSRNRMDTTYSLFPSNISGLMEIKGVRLRLSERNTFPLAASLSVDTVLMTGEDFEPYSVLDPLPLTIDIPMQTGMAEVFSQPLNCRINASNGNLVVSSDIIVNSEGMNHTVTVTNQDVIDLSVDVEVPFAFATDDVRYTDTIDLSLSNIELPELIEKLTLEFAINSMLPLNLNGSIYLYDSENERIVDALVTDQQLISASFNGQPAASSFDVEITKDRIEQAMHSDKIIMCYVLDTDAHDVVMNAQQKLDLFVKARVKYNGVVEFKN